MLLLLLLLLHHSCMPVCCCLAGAYRAGRACRRQAPPCGLGRPTLLSSLPSPSPLQTVSLPEARGMEPRELQAAVVATIAELRKSRVRRLMDWGTTMYR